MRRCEAMIGMGLESSSKQSYAPCGVENANNHHRLPRGRGGKILDKAGETYHLMDLCAIHHKYAHESTDAFKGGLMLEGYVTTCPQCGLPRYVGPDVYLTQKYGNEVHYSSLWACKALEKSS